jgi:thiol-disulfide isomerase/thioredoxin
MELPDGGFNRRELALNWRGRDRVLAAVLLLALASMAVAQSVQAPALLDLKGHPTSLAVYKGRIVIVNFWATWCAPCREEMPELNRLFGHIDKRQVAVVGIAADEPAAVHAFVTKLGIQYPIAIGDADQVFAWSTSLGNTTEGLPFSILLDGTGKVRWIKSGGRLTAPEVTRAIDKLLAASGKP